MEVAKGTWLQDIPRAGTPSTHTGHQRIPLVTSCPQSRAGTPATGASCTRRRPHNVKAQAPEGAVRRLPADIWLTYRSKRDNEMLRSELRLSPSELHAYRQFEALEDPEKQLAVLFRSHDNQGAPAPQSPPPHRHHDAAHLHTSAAKVAALHVDLAAAAAKPLHRKLKCVLTIQDTLTQQAAHAVSEVNSRHLRHAKVAHPSVGLLEMTYKLYDDTIQALVSLLKGMGSSASTKEEALCEDLRGMRFNYLEAMRRLEEEVQMRLDDKADRHIERQDLTVEHRAALVVYQKETQRMDEERAALKESVASLEAALERLDNDERASRRRASEAESRLAKAKLVLKAISRAGTLRGERLPDLAAFTKLSSAEASREFDSTLQDAFSSDVAAQLEGVPACLHDIRFAVPDVRGIVNAVLQLAPKGENAPPESSVPGEAGQVDVKAEGGSTEQGRGIHMATQTEEGIQNEGLASAVQKLRGKKVAVSRTAKGNARRRSDTKMKPPATLLEKPVLGERGV